MAITIITVWLAFQNIVFFPLKTYLYLSGKLPECGRETQFCEVLTRINQIAPPGTRLFMNTDQHYWLRSDLIQCLPTSQEIDTYLGLETDEQRWNYIYKRGISYLIIFDSPGFVFHDIRAPDAQHIPAWLSVTRWRIGADTILRLETRDSTRETDVECEQTTGSAWELVSPYFEPP